MRWIPDRFWWVQRYGGMVFAVGGLIAAIYIEIQAYEAYSLAQVPVSDTNLQTLLRLDGQQLLLGGIAYGLFVVLGIVFIWGSFRSRKRFQHRLRAIRGDQEAMPRAAIKIDAGSAHKLSGSALELMWRPTLLLRLVVALMDLIFLPVFGFWAGSGVYIAYEIVGANQEQQLFWLVRIGLLLLDVSLLVVAPLVMMGLLLCSVPMLLGKPSGVIADNDGMVYRSVVTRRRYVLRWEEITLFEVQPAMKAGQITYRLYGRGVIARWNDQPPSKGSSLGMSKEEFEQQHQALLDLIVARTHLLPRTFDEGLMQAASEGGSGRGVAQQRPGASDGDEPDGKHGNDEGAQGVAGGVRRAVKCLEDEDAAKEQGGEGQDDSGKADAAVHR